MAKVKRNKPRTLSDILTDSFIKMGLKERLRRDKALNTWPDIVGAEVAAVAKPLLVKNRVLFVAVESPSWINELNYYSDAIIRQINRVAGRDIIDKIRWQNAGELPDESFKEAVQEQAIPKVIPEELPEGSRLAHKIEQIEDEKFKAALKKLISVSRSAKTVEDEQEESTEENNKKSS